jgi:hypothetical protein
MTETLVNGRLGNQIFRNIAVSLIAEKHDLQVNYCNSEFIRKLGIELYNGSKVHSTTQTLSDDNYLSIYNCTEPITYNLDPNDHYFQSNHTSNIIHDYLHTEKVKSKIIQANPFKERYNNNNDVVVHIRLGDVANFSPGLNYYINTIKKISFDNLFITTDDKNHEMIRTLLETFPNTKLIEDDEIRTFQFASTCKHIILSHGSFSAIIGYLAYDSTVYYPSYNVGVMWFGDMFSIPNWIKVEL